MKMKIGRLIGLFICLVLAGASLSEAADKDVLAHWTFDEMTDTGFLEVRSGQSDSFSGGIRLLPGIKGQAVVLDGYTSLISRKADTAPVFEGDFSIEAWIAVGAYPWNWAPLAAQENTVSLKSNLDRTCWPDDIIVNSPRNGYFFGLGPGGRLGLFIGAGGWQLCRTDKTVPLRKWTHVAAVFKEEDGVRLYINGEEAGRARITARFRPAAGEDLHIGMPREKREPTHPVRAFATLAAWYSFDGLLDELKIYGRALDGEDVKRRYDGIESIPESALPPRIMPSGPEGRGSFGASYMRLKYYPEWDNLWSVSSDPDIVVQFDDSPVRVVFWRGTRYGPAWVMENGFWMGDQSIENFNSNDGCIEHMLDPRCRFSHVRIIEKTPARVVVHWRYCPSSANGNHSQVDEISGWEDWVDEYYTFYPDSVGIRTVYLHTEGRFLWPEEVIGLCHPGQRPEDVVSLDAMTLASMAGKSRTYTWAETTPEVREGDRYLHFGMEPMQKPVILMVNYKSDYKPFQIFEPDNRVRIFAHEHRKGISHFPWWNHWPVAQVPSDGRYCQAADRASHFSLAWGGPAPHEDPGGGFWWTWMYGATTGQAEALVPLAKSWNLPPRLAREGKGGEEAFYNKRRRCYELDAPQGENSIVLVLEGSPDSPIHNPALVVHNWGKAPAEISVDGTKVKPGKDLRIGTVRRLNRYDLIIWMRLEGTQHVRLAVEK